MNKKQLLLITAAVLCALILSSSSALAASGQEVRVPYVVSSSDGSWWTGIAITNGSGNAITDMELAFTTDTGSSRYLITLDGNNLEFLPYVYYKTDLAEIAGNAILIDSLPNLYAGTGIVPKTLPSEAGSVIFSHTGDEPFFVTVYIGGPTGFAYQVFESNAPSP